MAGHVKEFDQVIAPDRGGHGVTQGVIVQRRMHHHGGVEHDRDTSPGVIEGRERSHGARIDPDPGVAGFDHATVHRHAFKTPSLRNVELTAPYMHNGVYRTLEDVVDFYDRGGGAGIGIALPNQTLSPEPLRLSAREKRDLIAFMRALTDTTQVAGHRQR